MVRSADDTGGLASVRVPSPADRSRRLIAWYRKNGRDLPWRRTRDPYAVWVSEVMLQQTQVKTALGYYARFLERFPTLRELARANEAAVLQVWQGLGYYSRGRRLLSTAKVVLKDHRGRLPRSAKKLAELPGIGGYTAAAIASIAFDEPVAVVDGNVTRVLARLHALRGDPGRAPLKQTILDRAQALVPKHRPGDHNQAMMELGATICTPREPDCSRCPWKDLCQARARGLVQRLPELPARQKPTPVRMAAALVFRNHRVAVEQIAPDAPRWAGLWQFPMVELRRKETAAAGARRAATSTTGRDVSGATQVTVIRHSVTRFRIAVEAYRFQAGSALGRPSTRLSWKRPGELEELPMPSAQRRLAALLTGAG